MTTRSDIHRPAEFDPADYEVIDYLDVKAPDYGALFLAAITAGAPAEAASALVEEARALHQQRIFEHFPDWRTGGTDHRSISTCNHCGHPGLRWVAVVVHKPTGAKLAFGEICADRVEIPGRSAFRAKFIKTRAEREQARAERELERLAFQAANADVVAYLADYSERYAQGGRFSDFLSSLADQYERKGTLSEAQVAAARRSGERDAERAAQRAAESASITAAFPVGRTTVEGEIVSTKVQDGDYGITTKMLVRLDDGNKVYGTVPGELLREIGREALPGKRVRVTATFEQSRKDEHFGFYKRPVAEIV